MGFRTKWGRWPFAALTLITMGLVWGVALVAYADSIDYLSVSGLGQVQGEATSTATLVVPPTGSAASAEGAQSAGLGSTLAVTATATVTPTAVPPTRTPTPTRAPANVIVNGGFEEGFLEGQGVGKGWGRFQNGNVFAGWYDDTWSKVVYEGGHAQLLELRAASEPNRYVGIFQTVQVMPNAEYVLTLHGLVRSDPGSPQASNYGYRMQYGIDYKGGTNWESKDIQWVELMWDEQPRQDPTGANQYRMETYTTTVKAQTDKLTLYIRGWKKWADLLEGNYDIDGVSLVGLPGASVSPTATPSPGMPVTGIGSSLIENPVLLVASVLLLVVLAGGAAWGLAQRRT